MFSVIGAVLIVVGLYIVLWGKSKEMKKVTHLVSSEINLDSEEIEVVVTSTAVDDDHNSDCSSSRHTSSNSNIVGKVQENSSKGEHEVQDIKNKGKEDMACHEVSKA